MNLPVTSREGNQLGLPNALCELMQNLCCYSEEQWRKILPKALRKPNRRQPKNLLLLEDRTLDILLSGAGLKYPAFLLYCFLDFVRR